MKAQGELTAAVVDFGSQDTIVQLRVAGDVRADCEKLKGCTVEVNIKKYYPKRSLDSNNYAWVLLDKMAKVLHSSKEEVYKTLLERYGTFFYLPCEEDKVPNIEAVFRVVRDRGETTLTTPSGKEVKCRQLQCYKGSSLMDQAEMTAFLNGLVEEAKALGIDTATPDEIRRMNEAWSASGYKP